MNARQFMLATERELERWPGVTVRWTRFAKHPGSILNFNGQERRLTHPGSSSDRRAVKAHVTELRALLRSMGAEPTPRRKNPDSRLYRPSRQPLARAPEPIHTRLAEDPWAPLALLLNRAA